MTRLRDFADWADDAVTSLRSCGFDTVDDDLYDRPEEVAERLFSADTNYVELWKPSPHACVHDNPDLGTIIQSKAASVGHRNHRSTQKKKI